MKDNNIYKDLSKEEIIKKEKAKLNGIYSKLELDTKKSVNSLIEEASFMAASLYELRQIINDKGYTEGYQNGANQHGVKESSEVKIYNTMIKNYMSIMRQLTDLLPKNNNNDDDLDGFMEFVNSRD